MIDKRFPTAIQIMQSLALAQRDGDFLTNSAELAEWLGANRTLVRKLMAALVQQGLVISQMGRNGGVKLSRNAKEITLREIYNASVADKKLWVARTDIPPICVVSMNFEDYFLRLVNDIELNLLDNLDKKTLNDAVEQIIEIDKETGRSRLRNAKARI